MIVAHWAPYRLDFKFTARTSRETMRYKDTFFLRLTDTVSGRSGVGECALFRGLSADDVPDYEQRLSQACLHPERLPEESSIRFGLETARLNLTAHTSAFETGSVAVPINGLIWMGDRREMRRRIDEKLAAGFRVLKLKIGGIDFESELALLKYIRQTYSPSTLELRLDANGSFAPGEALEKLGCLAEFTIHSIEQPVRAGQREVLRRVCELSPIAVALDEELIGTADREELLDFVRPQFIIIKPALCGGLSGADAWADAAEARGIGWWATSALESNIGLHAIARWVTARGVTMPQGLGTGALYHNNIPSPLRLQGDCLCFDPAGRWEMPQLEWRQ